MKVIRNNIFETNSSSTHTLVLMDKKETLPPRAHKKNWKGVELPVNMDTPNLRVEIRDFTDGVDNSDLTHVEWMASYLFTFLHLMRVNKGWLEEHDDCDVDEALARLHELLLELELVPKYGPVVLEYHAYDYNLDKHYPDDPRVTIGYDLADGRMEFNDGGCIESISEVMDLLVDKDSLEKFLTEYKINIKYDG